MPANLERFQQCGDLHFITFSCFHRLPYFAPAYAMETFERSLETMRRKYAFFVLGYVIMPEHVHLLVTEPRAGSVAKALQAVKISVSAQLPQSPFWQRRYYDFNVFSEKKRVEKLRYIHRNPVHRGLVLAPEDWKWSSFNHHATGRVGVIEIESRWTAARREGLVLPHLRTEKPFGDMGHPHS
jgi:putative transposase